jgi:hypothetical protein
VAAKKPTPQAVAGFLSHVWPWWRRDAFRQAGKEEMTGEEVRAFLMSLLETRNPKDSNIRRFWKPLTAEEKEQALRSAFPDATYSLPAAGQG